MPAVLVAWPTATQNSPFLPQCKWLKTLPVLIAPTHRGIARLSAFGRIPVPGLTQLNFVDVADAVNANQNEPHHTAMQYA